MKIQVDSRSLKGFLSDFVGNTNALLNFKTDGSKLHMQYLGDYTAEKSLDCKSLDGDVVEVNASFNASKVLNVIDDNEPVTIFFSPDIIYLEQGNFHSMLEIEYEARRSFANTAELELKDIHAGMLKFLVHQTVTCLPMAKEVSIANPDPIFSKGKYYVDFNQSIYLNVFDFVECCISIDVLRAFAFKLDDSTKYCYIPELSVIYFKTDRYEFWIPTMNYNIDANVVNTCDKKIAESKVIANVCFREYAKQFKSVSTAFPKQTMQLGFSNNDIQLKASTTNTQVTIGETNDVMAVVNVTSAQLSVIASLFGEDENVVVRRGGNCICLIAMEKIMLIAETLY